MLAFISVSKGEETPFEYSQHFLLGKGGVGSIWQAGSLLLARSFCTQNVTVQPV